MHGNTFVDLCTLCGIYTLLLYCGLYKYQTVLRDRADIWLTTIQGVSQGMLLDPLEVDYLFSFRDVTRLSPIPRSF